MAIKTGGELIILAPGVSRFGEDDRIDQLIRQVYKARCYIDHIVLTNCVQFGYRTTPQVMAFLEQSAELNMNLGAAAHLIHGSSEGRFTVTYCPGGLTREVDD
jgi:hypothetical protein